VLSSNSIGFRVNEDIVTYADDSALRDPAVLTEGSADSNYYALGADRYKLSVSLESRPLLSDTDDTDPNFFEFIRVQNEVPSWVREDIIYDTLAKELAKRTYEESGDYTVECFKLQLMEHANASNAQVVGYYNSGGLANSMVALMGKGLAYVRGYRIETNYDTPITITKPRTYANVTTTTVDMTVGNWVRVTNVYGLPNLANDLELVDIYSDYKAGAHSITGQGNKIGTCRIRHIELESGNPQDYVTGFYYASWKLYIFDVQLLPGYEFSRSAKMLRGDGAGGAGFSCNFAAEPLPMPGSINLLSGNVYATGYQTSFTKTLADPRAVRSTLFRDYIHVKTPGFTPAVQNFRIDNVLNDSNVLLGVNVPTVTGTFPFFVHIVNIKEPETASYIVKLPFDYVRSVDANNDSTVFTAASWNTATLSANSASIVISGAVNESWTQPTLYNSLIVVTTGSKAGNVYTGTDGRLVLSNAQKTLTVDLASISGVSTADIHLVLPRTKTLDRASRRSKTLNTNRTYDVTNATAYSADVIELDRADGKRLVSVYESVPGTTGSFNATSAIEITSNYTFDTGQRTTHYARARIIRRAGAPVPQAPIQVTYDYFSHGASGDYFSVESYTDNGVDYQDVPSFETNQGKVYLNDYLDCRPVINHAGSGYSSTGAIKPDHILSNYNFTTSLSYFLAHNAMIGLSTNGTFNIKYSGAAPNGQARDPEPADDSMPLYVIRMRPYVRDMLTDVDVENLCVERYTMKDIGKLDRRITNLEYYTTLSLLEKQTESLQIKDAAGLDRFKNGFIVDNFTGFGVADTASTAAIDFRSNELRPKFSRKTF
jgi:cytoskeletal protein RodZ